MTKLKTTGYTQRFWVRAIELTMKHPKSCEECHVKNGEDITRALRPKKKSHATVRVALREPEIIQPENLGLFCTNCRRGKYEVRAKRADLEKLILPLFPQGTQAQ